MLVDESKMNHTDGVLVAHPHSAIGYQLMGALGRLGHRTIARSQEQVPQYPWPVLWTNDLSQTKCPTMVFTPQEPSTVGRPFSDSELLELTELSRGRPRVLVVSSWAEDPARIRKAIAGSDAATLLLTPPVFGFFDNNLFDKTLKHLRLRPALFLKLMLTPKPTPITSVNEAIATVVSALTVKHDPKNSFVVAALPAQTQSLDDFRRHIVSSFDVRPGRFAKIMAALTWQNWTEGLSLAANPAPLSSVAKSSSELWPNPTSPLKRSIDELKRTLDLSPEVKVIHRPGRSP
jgi:hypothetical protein